jgi:hypothetical protein
MVMIPLIPLEQCLVPKEVEENETVH